MQIPYELALGWRYTRAGRATRRNGFISFISGVSMLGIALGVAALIIVLSVVSHIEIFAPQGAALPDPARTLAEAKQNPNVVGAAPFYARLVETALREVERGMIEATQAMGGTTWQIVRRVLLPEALPGLIAGATVTAIALVGYTAMAGVVGAGGLGDLAIRFGYQRFQTDVMVVTVVLLLVIVQILQVLGDRWVARVSHR